MRGKIVNLCMALLNILIGITIVIYVMRIPAEITELTVQENQIMKVVTVMIYAAFGATTILNIIHYFINTRDGMRKTGYLIAIFSISFIFIKGFPIAIFSFLSAIIILISTIRERWVEANSITAISIIGIISVICILIIGSCFIYQKLGDYIIDKENENELAYKSDYFKYITELEIEEPYINIKKDGKYGYINPKGETVIDFQFDYASPFVQITMYDKSFDIALVCKDGSTWIILKNMRKVLTYRSESMDEDYEAKLRELEDVYYNVLNQEDDMYYEIDTNVNNAYKIPKYEEESDSYTYRYDYNEQYDIIVTQSRLGFGDTYELAQKDNLNVRIKLDCENLCYNENYLYVYSNGTIPFYDRSINKQGWFTPYGNKIVLKGKAQIIEIVGENILIKNHNDNTIYFINSDGDMVSDVYKEVFICNQDRFIVKNKNNKYIVINSSFEKVFESEWDFVDTSLVSVGLYIFGTTSGVINFNDYDFAENMNLKILNEDGNIIIDNAQQIYTKYYYISGDGKVAYSQRYSEFLNELKVMKNKLIGDEFYK